MRQQLGEPVGITSGSDRSTASALRPVIEAYARAIPGASAAAALRGSIAAEAARARRNHVPPERFLIAVKACLREFSSTFYPRGETSSEAERIISEAIASYFRDD